MDRERGSFEEAGQRPLEDDEAMRPGQAEERRSRNCNSPLRAGHNILESESEHLAQYKEQKRRDFRRKREEHSNNTAFGVNMPQTSQAEMCKVNEGLADLFKTEINPMTKESRPKTNDWEDWQVFEGAYKEALHHLRLHVVKTLKRDPMRLYDARRINPKSQRAQEKQSEALFTKHEIERRLMKVKSKLEQFAEYKV
jgi:hypothetical protein